MNRLRSYLRWPRDLIPRKLGVCPFCMRASALGTIIGWSLYGIASIGFTSRIVSTLLLLAASCFTLLLSAHLVAYMTRVGLRLRRRDALLRAHRITHVPPLARREFLGMVLRAGVYALAVSVFRTAPSFAQGPVCKAKNGYDQTTKPATTTTGDVKPNPGEALADLLAKLEATCDAFCLARNCGGPTCVTSAKPIPAAGSIMCNPVAGGFQCTGELKQCDCDCYACATIAPPEPYNEAFGEGTPGNEIPAMQAQATQKCQQFCAKIKCGANQHCERTGETLGKHKSWPIGGGRRSASTSIKNCKCVCKPN